jgi:ligand-binding sensor domain-containing protein
LANFLFWLPPLRGQNYPLRTIGLEEGLPALGINDLQSQVGGYLWLATEGAGLVNYNGYEFTSLLNEEMPVVKFLAAGLGNQLWFANTRRLGRYNGLSFQFYSLPASEKIVQLVSDSLTWVRGSSGRVYQAKPDTLEPLKSNKGEDLLQIVGHEQKLYGLYKSGVYLYKNQTWQLVSPIKATQLMGGRHLHAVVKDSLVSLQPVKNLSLLAGRTVKKQADHLFLWQGSNLWWRNPAGIERKISLPASKDEPQINNVHWHHNGTLVISSSQGLHILESPHIAQYGQNLGQVLAIANFKKYTVAGNAAGLHFFEDGKKQFSLPQVGLVLSLALWHKRLYVGSEQGLWSFKDGNLKPVAGLQNEFIFSLTAYQNRLMVGTGSGVYELDEKGQLINYNQQEGLPLATVFKMQASSQGNLWCGTYTQGFLVKNKKGWRHLRQWQGFRLDSLRYTTFWAQADSILWLGTQNNGLFKLGAKGVQHYTFADLRFAEVTHLEPLSTCTNSPDQDLWIGTNKGWLLLSEVEATRQGAGALHFIGSPVVANAVVQKSQTLYSGSSRGFQSFNACKYLRKEQPVAVSITNLKLLKGTDADLAPYGGALKPFTQLAQSLRLPHNSNYLSFSYAAQALQRPQEVRYRYRLKGQSNLWTYVGSRREALFADLNPGRYTLQVQARRPGNKWPVTSANYSFTIKRPFWETWWFIATVIILLFGTLFTLLRDRYKRLKLKLQLENDLMAMERKALRLQMNPHFIFNALDSISSFIFKKDQKQAVRYLNNFAKLMRLTLESSMEAIHPVETEVSILKNYLELEKLRFGNTFAYEIEVDEELDFNVGLPPMLVQPHVENAILHGLKPKGEGGFLKLSFMLMENTLWVTIEDNGIGRKKAKSLNTKRGHRSMATQINKDRLRLLQNSLGEKIDLKITDKYKPNGEGDGTQVLIKLPAQNI